MDSRKLNIKSISVNDIDLFEEVWKIYDYSFPDYEKRTFDNLKKTLEKEAFNIDTFLNTDGHVIAFLQYWNIGEFVYIEHFAVSSAARSGGIGSDILKAFIERHASSLIIFEIDPPLDEISKRRLAFYKRHGFHENCYFTFPAYRPKEDGFKMLLMSSCGKLNAAQEQFFLESLKNTIVTYGD